MADQLDFDIDVTEGADFQMEMHLGEDGLDLDLTGATFLAQIRDDFQQTSPVRATFTVSAPIPTNGKFYLQLANADTVNLFPAAGPLQRQTRGGFYDVFMTLNNVRTRLVGGRVLYHQAISRSV